MKPRLSVIIPAYNEEKVIGNTIAKIASYLEARGDNELIIVDDGSRDSTVEIVKGLMAKHPCLRLVVCERNGGKGQAVRQGVMHSQGEFVLYTDADLVYPIEGETAFTAALEAGEDVAIGCRSHPETLFALNPRHFPYIYQRYLVGRIYILIANSLLKLDVKDTQCGFKLFRGDVARDIFSRVRNYGFAFDVEVIYIARYLGYRVVEMPVYFLYLGEQSSVELARDSIRMLRGLWSIRTNGRLGVYAEPSPQ
ncbi:MAG TPA: dolichyl-phosphate beta-glucosyltransferase [Chloroflexota bacterium]|nr:dolichyl-phosphate beta-glucosyltransferase [Chloroflexota bacterium]